MTRVLPSPWEATILTLAAYRIWKLAAEDKILDRPRDRLPHNVAEFVECSWCAGFHTSWVAYAGWRLAPRATMTAAVPFALSAVVGLISHATE